MKRGRIYLNDIGVADCGARGTRAASLQQMEKLKTRHAMARSEQLRAFLKRFQDHKTYCERQLSDFLRSADKSDPRQELFRSDLQRTESIVRRLQKQLEDLERPMENIPQHPTGALCAGDDQKKMSSG